MRCAITILVSLLLLGPAIAAAPTNSAIASVDAVTRWIANYRAKPEPYRLPAAVRVLSQAGAFKDAENSGVYVGFIAGVLGSNPALAQQLVAKMLFLPPADQWALVRAIAYSGLSDWKSLMAGVAEHMPSRKVMIDKYLAGKLPTLSAIALENKKPTLWEKARSYLAANQGDAKEVTFERNPELLDTLWGYYFASGCYTPIARIIAVLPWSKERDNVDKLTVGSMAKYTLVSNAARDLELLAMLKWASEHQRANITPVLKEVIDAVDTMDTTRVRKDALAAIDELKRKGPNSRREMTTWGQIGQGALALGCVVAAATGQVALGLPCVIGWAASSAVMSYWSGQQ